MDKKILKDISYGLYLVSSKDLENNKDVGCIINTLVQLNGEVVVSICLNKENYTNKVIKKTKKFIVSILPYNVDDKVIGTFGFKSSDEVDKFLDFESMEVDEIKVLKNDICGYLECEVLKIVDVGSHDLFIAKVIKMEKLKDEEVMTYKYYYDVRKGKAPAKAPTYIEEEIDNSGDEDSYVCEICGYVHKGELPDDFVCPRCGVSKEHFKKIEK